MKAIGLLILPSLVHFCFASACATSRPEAEYYVAAYAGHYALPIEFVRAIVEQESGWQRCAVSPKGAMGIMQLMPDTARQLGVANRLDLEQSISGGVRLLAWLTRRFRGDLRLAAAAYYAGMRATKARGLKFSNPEVIAYVAAIRRRVERERQLRSSKPDLIQERVR